MAWIAANITCRWLAHGFYLSPQCTLVHMQIVELTREPIELYKILKFEGLVSSGGEAKSLIDDGQVEVNGEVETRRRRKIVCDDVVTVGDHQLRMVRAPD